MELENDNRRLECEQNAEKLNATKQAEIKEEFAEEAQKQKRVR